MTPHALHLIYSALQASEAYLDYRKRHGIESANILSIIAEPLADGVMARLGPEISGKVVVEIGAGTGLLGVRMGAVAKRVFCIEANPWWGLAFVHDLVARKPKNVSFLLGAAEEFEGIVHGDVAVFCAHIGVPSLAGTASKFAPKVIDVYGELFGRDATEAEAGVERLRAAGF
ncbi:MAG: hypothetical protein ACRELF_25880 [Gemmataceae bacterium]